jgi:hypothetical protein
MQPDDHHPQFFVSELQQDKDQVRSYKSEFRADAIGILFLSPHTGTSVAASTRKGIPSRGIYETTEGLLHGRALDVTLFSNVKTRLLPNVNVYWI